MTNRQKLEIKKSENRERLNILLNQETRTEVEVNELRELTETAKTLEVEYRASVVAEGEEESRAKGEFRDNQDGETAEIRSLFNRVTLNDYLNPAKAGIGLSGASVELAAALKVPTVGPNGGTAVPFDLLEIRAWTDTGSNDGGEMQRPILQRLFGPGILDSLGVRLDSVPSGRTEWPLVSGGVAPAQTKETVAGAAAVEMTFSYANLKAKKLTGSYEYSHEIHAAVPEIEQASRRDLADAVKSKMSDLILNGAAPTNTNPHNVEGFLTKLTATDLATAAATAADYGRLHAMAVDGIHASKESEVMSVVGDDTYRHSAGVYITGSGGKWERIIDTAFGWLHGEHVHSRHCQHEAKSRVTCSRTERRRHDERRFRGGNLADVGSDSRPLHESQSRRGVDVDFALGCLYRVPKCSL